MRGKHRFRHFGFQRKRIIPAHAGQTVIFFLENLPDSDHPRACGANDIVVFFTKPCHGSSPRMRGKPGLHVAISFTNRIIPAHAGQTCRLRVFRRFGADHPRACGANAIASAASSSGSGSSPRMRGKLAGNRRCPWCGRIIPAHAGQTRRRSIELSLPADHPRACGANFAAAPFAFLTAGSSPRMRGKQSDFMRKLLSAGPSIIGFAQWLQSSYYCSCLQSSAKTPISRGTTPTSLFLGFQNSITLLLLT